MGIHNLNRILKKHCKNGIKEINIKELKGNFVAIDTSIFLYKFSFMGNMINSFILQITHLLKNNITPVYLFDGKPTTEKKELIKDRKEKLAKKESDVRDLKEKRDLLKQSIDDIKQMDNNEEIIEKLQRLNLEYKELCVSIGKKEKSCIRIDWNKVKILKEILEKCNIYYYQCEGETDIYVKEFFKHNLIDYALTEDLDFLTHGCKKVLYGYNYKKQVLQCYNLNIILEELELTQEKFIDMCILMGCDYTSTIKKIGPITAYKLMKLHNNIEEILEEIKTNKKYKKYIPKEDFNHIKARNMFNLHYNIDISKKKLRIKRPDNTNILTQQLIQEAVNVKNINNLIKSFQKIKKINKPPKNIMMFLNKKKK